MPNPGDSMYVTIYRLRRAGVRLDPDAVRATAASGWLIVSHRIPGSSGMPHFHARLEGVAANRDEPPHLMGPYLHLATPAGLVLKGQEYATMAVIWPQAWFVTATPAPVGVLPPPRPTDTLRTLNGW